MTQPPTAPSTPLLVRLKRRAGRFRRRLFGNAEIAIPTFIAVRVNPQSVVVDLHPSWAKPIEEVEDAEAALLPQRVRQVLIWRTNQDQPAVALARSLHRDVFARTASPVAFVDERNPHLAGAPTMLDVVERIRPSQEAFFAVRQSCLVIVQDPYSALPIAVAHTWPSARVILILTRAPAFPLTPLLGVEALLTKPGVKVPDEVLDTTPFHAEFSDNAELNSIVRALWNVARPYPQGYLSVVKGSPEALRDYHGSGNEDIVVAMPADWSTSGAEFSDFRSYLYTVWSSALAVGVHSKFTYSYESLVARPDVNLLMVLIDRGARVTFTAAAEVSA